MRQVDRFANALTVCVLLVVGMVAPAQADRAIYIHDPAPLLDAGPPRERLFAMLAAQDITHVIPYGLGPLLDGAANRGRVAAWFTALHARGVQVMVPVASTKRLVALDALIAAHPQVPLAGMVTESEYWNVEDRDPAFTEFIALLDEMRARRRTWQRPVRVGAYLGYPTAQEATRIAKAVDFVFLNYAVRTPQEAWGKRFTRWGSLRTRYAAFARTERWPIFYATGEVVMPALRQRGFTEAEKTFTRAAVTDGAKAPSGFAYFTYEALVR